MIAFIKAGVELAFETMVEAGIVDESAYYESLHELPLIANLIARKKLYEMNMFTLLILIANSLASLPEFTKYIFDNFFGNFAAKFFEREIISSCKYLVLVFKTPI